MDVYRCIILSFNLHERLITNSAVPMLLVPALLLALHWILWPSSCSGWGVNVQVPATESSMSHLSVSHVYIGLGFVSVALQVNVSGFVPSVMKVDGPTMVVWVSSGPSAITNFIWQFQGLILWSLRMNCDCILVWTVTGCLVGHDGCRWL